ncbi:MAG: hypothetical protein U0768_04600 [Anaerolineae bacterium]
MTEHLALPQRAFLIRCWQDGHSRGDDAPAWRFSVEEVGGDRQRYGFTSLDSLVVFLEQWMQDVAQ